MSEELRQKIEQQIEAAFADTPYPGDDQIGKGANDEVTLAFRGTHWRDLSLKYVIDYGMDLQVLTPEGFRFYLPAFLLAVIRYYGQVSMLPISLMHSLAPPDPNLYLKYQEKQSPHHSVSDFLSRVSVFTLREKAAIREFLMSYRKLYPEASREQRHLNRALDFWKTA